MEGNHEVTRVRNFRNGPRQNLSARRGELHADYNSPPPSRRFLPLLPLSIALLLLLVSLPCGASDQLLPLSHRASHAGMVSGATIYHTLRVHRAWCSISGIAVYSPLEFSKHFYEAALRFWHSYKAHRAREELLITCASINQSHSQTSASRYELSDAAGMQSWSIE